MFKRSRRKIVAAIMSILVSLYIGTLCVIYASSYTEVSNRNREMLGQYVALYPANRQQMNDMVLPGSGPGSPPPGNAPAFRLSTFYSVELSYGGEIIRTSNGETPVYDSGELEAAALAIFESGRREGTTDNLVYRMADKGGYLLVAFMDNTIMQESMTTLFRYTLIFGGLAVAALFFFAVYLARRIVKPLEESYQKQRQFISDAGHELKTPVSVVSANAEVLAREIGENPWLANIQYENERMGRLVGQLLELARTETVAPQTARLDFSRLVAGEALPFETVAFEKGLVLDYRIADGLSVSGDPVRLKQLVSILLDNAIRHGSGGREITLCLERERGMARLSVINDGERIPPEQKKQLFDRFYRADTARTGGGSHYGLGLAIAKAITDGHNGRIDVLCHNGKIEFTVFLPLQK